MNLASHFVPFLKSAPPKAIKTLGLGVVVALVAVGPAGAVTVDREKVAEGGHRFEVRCGEPQTYTWTLPAPAQRVEVLEPVPGQAVTDGFGESRVATVRDVLMRTAAGGSIAVDVTVVGSDAACDGPGGGWLTTGVDFRARYHLVTDEPVLLSDDQAGMHARERPSRLTANSDAGWRRLRWRSWGGASAVARGVFTARRWIPIGHTDVVQRTFSYPVAVTVSRIRICGDHKHYYTRNQTRFLSAVPTEVRRQAKPLGTASCLRARPGG
jgi:hypothetical protein